jgi:hypothetical protein
VIVVAPMIFKAPGGMFEDAPDITSLIGGIVLSGVAVMLVAVVLASLAGFGRDREMKKQQQTSGSFLVGLIMTVIAGVTSAGLWLAFIYAEGPVQSYVCMVESGTEIKLNVNGGKEPCIKALCGKFAVGKDGKIVLKGSEAVETEKTGDAQEKETAKKIAAAINGKYTIGANGTIALKNAEEDGVPIEKIEPIQVAGINAKSAADKIAGALDISQSEDKPYVKISIRSVWAVFPVWASAAFSGALLNLLYPIILMTKGRSWGVLLTNWKEFGLTGIMGFQTFLALTLPGKGMLMLGALGAAIGGGIQQAMQMVGGQGTGFISGEWRGVEGKPRYQMYGAIALLILASFIMAYSKTIKQ